MGHKLEWLGRHWAVRLWPRPYVNVPYWPHRIIVAGWGGLDRHGRFHDHRPCCYRMVLRHCCPGRA